MRAHDAFGPLFSRRGTNRQTDPACEGHRRESQQPDRISGWQQAHGCHAARKVPETQTGLLEDRKRPAHTARRSSRGGQKQGAKPEGCPCVGHVPKSLRQSCDPLVPDAERKEAFHQNISGKHESEVLPESMASAHIGELFRMAILKKSAVWKRGASLNWCILSGMWSMV